MDKRSANGLGVTIVGLGLALTVGALAFYGASVGASVGVGAVMAAANWFALQFLVSRIVFGTGQGRYGMVALVLLKMAAVMGLISWLILRGFVLPIPFAAGLSTLVAGLMIGSFLYIARASGTER